MHPRRTHRVYVLLAQYVGTYSGGYDDPGGFDIGGTGSGSQSTGPCVQIRWTLARSFRRGQRLIVLDGIAQQDTCVSALAATLTGELSSTRLGVYQTWASSSAC